MSLLDHDPSLIESASLASAELRRDARYVCIDAGVLRLAVRPEFRGRRGVMVDVSARGIGFLLEHALEAGTVLVFEVRTPSGMETIGRIARVRHSRPNPVPPDAPWLPRTPALSEFFRRIFGQQASTPVGQAWLVGCEFDQPLHEDEIKQLLDPCQAQRVGVA
jgi:hypothetical protein